jgi:hypothetical protein
LLESQSSQEFVRRFLECALELSLKVKWGEASFIRDIFQCDDLIEVMGEEVTGLVEASECVVVDQPWSVDLRDTFHASIYHPLSAAVLDVDARLHPIALVSARLEMARADQPSSSSAASGQLVDVARGI